MQFFPENLTGAGRNFAGTAPRFRGAGIAATGVALGVSRSVGKNSAALQPINSGFARGGSSRKLLRSNPPSSDENGRHPKTWEVPCFHSHSAMVRPKIPSRANSIYSIGNSPFLCPTRQQCSRPIPSARRYRFHCRGSARTILIIARDGHCSMATRSEFAEKMS